MVCSSCAFSFPLTGLWRSQFLYQLSECFVLEVSLEEMTILHQQNAAKNSERGRNTFKMKNRRADNKVLGYTEMLRLEQKLRVQFWLVRSDSECMWSLHRKESLEDMIREAWPWYYCGKSFGSLTSSSERDTKNWCNELIFRAINRCLIADQLNDFLGTI